MENLTEELEISEQGCAMPLDEKGWTAGWTGPKKRNEILNEVLEGCEK